jgi:hypothetical protein
VVGNLEGAVVVAVGDIVVGTQLGVKGEVVGRFVGKCNGSLVGAGEGDVVGDLEGAVVVAVGDIVVGTQLGAEVGLTVTGT